MHLNEKKYPVGNAAVVRIIVPERKSRPVGPRNAKGDEGGAGGAAPPVVRVPSVCECHCIDR